MAETKKSKSLYGRILEAGEAAISGVSNKLKESKDKRAFDSAYDSLLEQKDKIEQEKQKFYTSVGEYGDKLHDHLKLSWKLRDIDDSIAMLKEEYETIFGEKYNPRY